AATTMKIVGVQEPKVPELDDAFVASFGVSEGGLERFKEDVRANLERELASALNMRLKASTVEKLVDANADIELPQGMIEAEARDMARRSTQGKEEVSHEPFLTAARRRVAGGLLLAEISRQNDISVDTGRVVEALSAIASTYEQPGEVIELYRNDPQLMSGLQSQVLEDQVVAWIAEHAKVTDQTMSFNEVMRPGG
ncbi:MAG: trigger factor, partial [Dokdonella sp.]